YASVQRGLHRPPPSRLPHPPRLHQPRLLPCRAQPARRPLLHLQAAGPPARGSRSGIMAAQRSQVVASPGSRAASPGCGYESPSKDNQPGFFLSPSPTPSIHRSRPPVPAPAGAPAARPPFLAKPSYVAAAPPERLSFNTAVPRSNQPSLNDLVAKSEKMPPNGKVTIKDRIACYQWTYFTMTMATGGIANVIHALSYRAPWITGVGTFFCVLNVVFFLTNCVLLSTRFYLRPGSFTHSFTDQVESLFIPAFVRIVLCFVSRFARTAAARHVPLLTPTSIAIIMINICEYGVPRSGVWLLRTMEVMFWFYVALSAFASAGMYLILWSTMIFPVHMMTPTWVFPAYPLLLTAPFAANLIDAADVSGHALSLNTTAVALGAATTQGTGCLIAFMISAAFLYRLMTQKLPRDMQRPGVFISIGPFGFTAAGIAQLGRQAKTILPHDFLGAENAGDIIKVVSILVGLWLWGLSMWFFLVSVGSLWKYIRTGSSMPFQMTWWSFVFPNTALVTATEVMGDIFESKGIQLFGGIMTVALIVVWIGVFVTMIHCLRTKKLLWPKDNV
ncbi:hypothetical protein TPAR_01658, partial [Tolypocladium paradoxum]